MLFHVSLLAGPNGELNSYLVCLFYPQIYTDGNYKWIITDYNMQTKSVLIPYKLISVLICGLKHRGQIVAEVRGLVVAHVLPCHCHTVGVVVHEGGDTVGSGTVGGEDVEMRGIGDIPEDKLLAPVAHEVSLKIRSGLGPVARTRIAHLVKHFSVAQRQRLSPPAVPLHKTRREERTAR